MPRVLVLVIVVFAGLFAGQQALAMGFARTLTQSTLGQPLNFVATISLEQDESLSRQCVSAQVIAGDARLLPTHVHVSIGAVHDGALRDVRVGTTTPIDEPVVTIELSIGCSSTMSRSFVAFIDPPSVQLAQQSPIDADIDTPAVSGQTAALADLARRADASRRGTAGHADSAHGDALPKRDLAASVDARRHAGAGGSRGTGSERAHLASGRHRDTRFAAAAAHGSSRLQLDAPRLLATTAGASSAATSAASPLAAPSLGTAASAAPAPVPVDGAISGVASPVEHDRMVMLEAAVASLRDESIATRKTMDVLQSRLHEAEGARYANGLVYALAGISFGLGLVVAALLWIRPRQQRRSRWFEAAAERHARTTRSAEREAAAETMPTVKETVVPTLSPPQSRIDIDMLSDFAPTPSSFMPMTEPAAIGGLEVTTVLGPQFARAALLSSTGASANDLSTRGGDFPMEELIDLEQQAEFFVVLGQDEAAMSLLDNYTRGEGARSPLPYLQLLEIHQRRGGMAAFESVRRAFNARFNADAPEWRIDLHVGRSLVDFPQTIARLQSLWATPLSAMHVLNGLLLRRQPSDEIFDFPTYRDLLFLYSIAREISGQVETDLGSIDLFLPLDDAAFLPPMAPMAPSNTFSGGLELAVDLDVTT